jgi:hypothetical protein
MSVNYTRQSSVILNPRGRVLRGLGGGYEGEGTGVDSSGPDNDAADAAREASFSASARDAAVAQAEAQAAAEAAAAALAAAEEASYTAQEASRFANAAASATAAALAAQQAQDSVKKAAELASKNVQGFLARFGPIGFVVSMVESMTGFLGGVIAGTATKSGYVDAQQAIDNAHNQAGNDLKLHAQINKVQKTLDVVNTLQVNKPNLQQANEQVFTATAKQIYADPSMTQAQKQKSVVDLYRSTGVSVDFIAAFYSISRDDVLTVIARNPPSAAGLPLIAVVAAAAYFFIGA